LSEAIALDRMKDRGRLWHGFAASNCPRTPGPGRSPFPPVVEVAPPVVDGPLLLLRPLAACLTVRENDLSQLRSQAESIASNGAALGQSPRKYGKLRDQR